MTTAVRATWPGSAENTIPWNSTGSLVGAKTQEGLAEVAEDDDAVAAERRETHCEVGAVDPRPHRSGERRTKGRDRRAVVDRNPARAHVRGRRPRRRQCGGCDECKLRPAHEPLPLSAPAP